MTRSYVQKRDLLYNNYFISFHLIHLLQWRPSKVYYHLYHNHYNHSYSLRPLKACHLGLDTESWNHNTSIINCYYKTLQFFFFSGCQMMILKICPQYKTSSSLLSFFTIDWSKFKKLSSKFCTWPSSSTAPTRIRTAYRNGRRLWKLCGRGSGRWWRRARGEWSRRRLKPTSWSPRASLCRRGSSDASRSPTSHRISDACLGSWEWFPVLKYKILRIRFVYQIIN